MEERRIMAVRDGRRLPPRNSRGEFRRRRSRRDRGMYDEDMRGSGSQYSMRRYRDYNQSMMGDDYEGEDMRLGNRSGQDYGDMAVDGHYPKAHGSTYYPIQAMGTFEGYYGMPEEDYGYDMRGRGRDYGYDMRGRGGRGRDYGYDYGYDYGDYGDYGETLSDKELEEWCHKLKSKLTDQEKQIFSKESIAQRSKAMGRPMEGFGEKELEVVTLMLLDDYKRTLGANPDTMIKLAFDWLDDKDASVKGAEKLTVYYEEIVEGGDE
jgi:hypothetical protein